MKTLFNDSEIKKYCVKCSRELGQGEKFYQKKNEEIICGNCAYKRVRMYKIVFIKQDLTQETNELTAQNKKHLALVIQDIYGAVNLYQLFVMIKKVGEYRKLNLRLR